MSESTHVKVEKPASGRMFLAFSLVTFSYLIALAAAIGIAWGFTILGLHPIWRTLLATVGGTFVIFIFSVLFDNVSFYDPYWSVQPIFIATYWMILGYGTANFYRQVLVLAVVSFWGVRLTLNWIRGWKGLEHEDWRYVKYRKEQPKLFWFIAFAGLEMMPTLIVYLGCIAFYPALVLSSNDLNLFDLIAVIIAVGATLIEFIADEQLKIFSKMNDDPEKVMDLGLWGVSRHPNYFGEISFWWGLFFFALAADLSWWWTVAGGIAMVILFVFVSIPLMEKKQIEKRVEYSEYKKNVSMLIPWFSGD
ncbi:MAG: DUF1295 domain-containing protein [Candidatus Heimdallarchaeota archaeon]|nr:DUF1295 domain-containing protein [Candidatus Heimdallarchaeota archaeon]